MKCIASSEVRTNSGVLALKYAVLVLLRGQLVSNVSCYGVILHGYHAIKVEAMERGWPHEITVIVNAGVFTTV